MKVDLCIDIANIVLKLYLMGNIIIKDLVNCIIPNRVMKIIKGLQR